MKISVEHTTIYQYSAPVQLEPHTFRLKPRTNDVQRLESFGLYIWTQPAGSTECLDQDGNHSLNAWFNTPVRQLEVRSRFTVELLRANPFDYILFGEPLHLPLWYRDPLCQALAPYRNTNLVADSVQQFAYALGAEADWDALHFLNLLTQRIFQNHRPLTRPTGGPWESSQTLSSGQGSCRDLAVLFVDACRAMGFAARFVSGYECASATSNDNYMHAWAEVYLPPIGWRGYDPSRGLAVANGHVAVAAGFDPEMASPISGCFYGASDSVMLTSVWLRVHNA